MAREHVGKQRKGRGVLEHTDGLNNKLVRILKLFPCRSDETVKLGEKYVQ